MRRAKLKLEGQTKQLKTRRFLFRVMPAFVIPSFAKINLHLQVIGKRDDGFHDLCTVFQTVSFKDDMSFAASHKIVFSCDQPNIPTDERNLIVQTAKLMQQRFRVKSGAHIHLEKRIPSPGGLGGGSSNAAVAIIGLSRLWEINATEQEMLELAAEIGSDVPFFLHGGTCLGLGRGEVLETFPDFIEPYLLIVTPDAAVSTHEAFERLSAANLTKEESKRILQICRFDVKSTDFHHAALKNDFESTVFVAYPEVERGKQTLYDLGARQTLLCGSGASVFGIFDKEETRQAAMKALDKEINWRKFAVATISRASYREKLGLAD